MTTTSWRKCWGWSGLAVWMAVAPLGANDAPSGAVPDAPSGAAQVAPPTDVPAEAPSAGSPNGPSSGSHPPVPIHEGAAHHPGTAYGWGPEGMLGHPGWVQYPSTWNGYWNYATAYGAPGYTAYWHGWYAGPRYVDWYGPWWEGWGWRAGPYWDYAWPTWSHHGWGYSSVGWGWGHSHDYYPWAYAPCHGRWGMIRRW